MQRERDVPYKYRFYVYRVNRKAYLSRKCQNLKSRVLVLKTKSWWLLCFQVHEAAGVSIDLSWLPWFIFATMLGVSIDLSWLAWFIFASMLCDCNNGPGCVIFFPCRITMLNFQFK